MYKFRIIMFYKSFLNALINLIDLIIEFESSKYGRFIYPFGLRFELKLSIIRLNDATILLKFTSGKTSKSMFFL